MTRFAVAAFVLLIAASPAAAAAPPLTAVQAQAQLNTFRRELATFIQPYNAGMARAEALSMTIIEGANKALTDYGDAGPRKVRQAWSRDWVAKIGDEVTVLKAAQAALPPAPDAAFDKLSFRDDPGIKRMRTALGTIPATAGTLFASVYDMADRTLPLVARVADNDDEAVLPLTLTTIDGIRLTLMAENVMLDLPIATTPTHPQGGLSRAMKASNEAMMAMLGDQAAELRGESPDRPALIATIRTKARQSRTAATEVPGLAAASAKTLSGMPAGGQLTAVVTSINKSYRESSEVEIAIAGLMDKTADALEQGKTVSAAMSEETALLDGLVNRRLELQRERLRALGQ